MLVLIDSSAGQLPLQRGKQDNKDDESTPTGNDGSLSAPTALSYALQYATQMPEFKGRRIGCIIEVGGFGSPQTRSDWHSALDCLYEQRYDPTRSLGDIIRSWTSACRCSTSPTLPLCVLHPSVVDVSHDHCDQWRMVPKLLHATRDQMSMPKKLLKLLEAVLYLAHANSPESMF